MSVDELAVYVSECVCVFFFSNYAFKQLNSLSKRRNWIKREKTFTTNVFHFDRHNKIGIWYLLFISGFYRLPFHLPLLLSLSLVVSLLRYLYFTVRYVHYPTFSIKHSLLIVVCHKEMLNSIFSTLNPAITHQSRAHWHWF